MAQAIIEMRFTKKTTSTQTGDNFDFTFLLSKTKTSGKTWLLKRELVYNADLFDTPPLNIVFYYSAWPTSFDNFNEISPDVKFNKGNLDIDELDTSQPNLIILDDLMKECFLWNLLKMQHQNRMVI
ncbi:unnamed protein product [Brachionus calyciflorus]|uniref:Uncharacterized protein n=1 Tax=Brachionus calyciflorus TaxID=104777 RepID=A0A813WRW1_9BILA|nr:unnamed protein product [Brachionus calyciflorus]